MSAQAPQVLSRRTNGGPPATANQTHDSTAKGKSAADGGVARTARDTQKVPKTRAPNEGEKVVIRRLPPGMTQAEFVAILGPEWEVGNGKIDWFSYARGKVTNDLPKPSRPARAYIHLTRKDHIIALSEAVRSATWEDAKLTFTSPSLIGPPSLEFCAYKKVPGMKKRTDARQGTIDQDPEFMAFLEGLANPTPLRESIENEEGEDVAETKVTTTPLIEYLKEKKANKAKEAAAAKSAKHSRQEAAAAKGKGASKDEDGSKKKGKESKNAKPEKPTAKEAVKILTKKAATAEQATTGQAGAASSSTNANATEAPAPKSRRAGIAAAARILQRDLGLSPGSAHRRARQDAAKGDADSKATPTKENKESTAAANEKQTSPVPAAELTNTQASAKAQPTTSSASKAHQSGRRNRGGKNADKSKSTEAASGQSPATTIPVILKKKGSASGDAEAPAPAAETASASQQNTNSKSTANTTVNGPKGGANKSTASQKKPAAVSANATRGFVKHANPSQGINEPVLKQALEVFGAVTFIEMDKRKGFAYVDFADHSSLVKAVSAGPVTVAQGTVQILERKDKKPAAASPSSGNTASAPAGGSTNNAASEKGSGAGRGRRGRGGGGGGGGGKGIAVANGHQPATANNSAPTTNGG